MYRMNSLIKVIVMKVNAFMLMVGLLLLLVAIKINKLTLAFSRLKNM